MIIEFARMAGYSVDVILGDSRKKEIVAARQLYWKLLRENGFSLEQIANLSGYSHSNVLQGIRVANERLEVKDKTACAMWNKVKNVKFED